MNPRSLSSLFLAALLLGGIARPGPAQSGTPVYNPANGHWYQIVTPAGPVSWQQARDAAAALSYAGLSGHLATVTSLEENQFLWDQVIQHNPSHSDYLLGGYQDRSAPDYSEPAGGWRWVTGEPWSFTLWAPGEPNNTDGVEDVLGYWSPQLDHWNDFNPAPRMVPFIVEYEPLPIGGAANNAGLVLFPNPVPGGLLALGQVTLSQPAASGGALLTLASSNPAAAVLPAVVTVLDGASSVTFPIVTFPVAAPAAVLISASSAFGSATAMLQVLQNPPGITPPTGLPAPTNLSAQLLIEARVQLAWTAPSTDVDGFAIWRQSPTSDWAQVGLASPHATTFLDPGVGPSTAYRYRVRATRGSLTSDWSNEAALTTPAAPSAPTGLRVELLGTTLVSLTWSADSSNATAMTVFRQTAGGDWSLVGERQPYVRQFTDRGLMPNTRYSYRVVAHNNEFVSAWSNEVSVTTLGP